MESTGGTLKEIAAGDGLLPLDGGLVGTRSPAIFYGRRCCGLRRLEFVQAESKLSLRLLGEFDKDGLAVPTGIMHNSDMLDRLLV